jgi:hypothetical protein
MTETACYGICRVCKEYTYGFYENKVNFICTDDAFAEFMEEREREIRALQLEGEGLWQPEDMSSNRYKGDR